MKTIQSILVSCSFFLGNLSARADTHFVDPGGGDLAPYTTPATAAQDPADAIAAASAGDTVAIADGVYSVSRPLDASGLTVLGVSTNAVLEARGMIGVMVGRDCTLSNLTIQNGSLVALRGAGAAVTNAVVNGCVFQDNVLQSGIGGGFGSTSSIRGAGLYAEDSQVGGCLFRRNGHENLGGCHQPHVQGGGAYFVRCQVQDCLFVNNECDDGAAFWAADETVVVNCEAMGNSKYLGHPIVLDRSALSNSVVRGNTWGVWARNSSQVLDCEISDNVGDFGGFAFACVETSPGGAGILLENNSVARRCRITGNSCGFGAGVMISFSGDGPPRLQNCLIAGNSLQDSEFDQGSGSGILLFDSAIIEHCTFVENRSSADSGVVQSETFGLPLNNLVFRNNIVWGNDGTSLVGNLPLADFTSNILEGTNVPSNVSVPPLLGSDYRLQLGSPAIDAGDSANPPPGVSLFGLPRVLGAATDIGADEFHPELLITKIENLDSSDDEAALLFNTLPGVRYQFERSLELAPMQSWSSVGPMVIGGMGTNSTAVLPTPGTRGYFRVRIVP